MGVDDAGAARLGIRNNISALTPIPIDVAREDFIRSHNDMLAQSNTNAAAVKTNAAAITTLQNASVVEAWKSPTYQNGWTAFNDPTTGQWQNGRYKKLPSGLVLLSGLVAGPNRTDYVVFTLPVGYRPLKQLLWPTLAQDAVARVDVLPNGNVLYQPNISGSVAAPAWLDLSPVAFWAEQ